MSVARYLWPKTSFSIQTTQEQHGPFLWLHYQATYAPISRLRLRRDQRIAAAAKHRQRRRARRCAKSSV